MNNFAKNNNASLAPHCKTFMSPQLINHHLKKHGVLQYLIINS